MVRILATGPESSGTRWLAEILADAGADVVHRSQPDGGLWLDMVATLEDFDAAVVVVRGRYAHLESLRERLELADISAAADRRRRSLATLAPILGHPKTTVVTYESLSSPVEARHLLAGLGLDPEAADRVPCNDATAHRLTASGEVTVDLGGRRWRVERVWTGEEAGVDLAEDQRGAWLRRL